MIVVRTFQPKEGMLQRWTEWHEDLKENMPWARMLISMDTTRNQASGTNYTEKIRSKVPQAIIHEYNSNLVKSIYHAQVLQDKDPHEIGRVYHMEPMGMALDYAEKHFGEKFDYIWMLEDDVMICGQLSAFLGKYKQDRNDLISAPDWKEDFFHGFWKVRTIETSSKEFRDRYKTSQLRAGEEVMQRLSRPLLTHIDELSRLHNVTTQSEIFSYTVAKNDGFTIEDIVYGKDKHGYDKKKLNNYFRYTQAFAKKLCKEKEEKGEISVHHRVKWARVANSENNDVADSEEQVRLFSPQ